MRNAVPQPHPQRLTKKEAREALPEELRETFDKLCEKIGAYGSSFISYSIVKELGG
jgi:hypothetical protein